MPYEFHDERGAGGEYIPLRQRRPSVRYPLARIVVDDSLSLTFSEGPLPSLRSSDNDTRMGRSAIAAESGLGSSGSAATRGSPSTYRRLRPLG